MAIGYSVKLPLEMSPSDGPFALNKTIPSVVEQNIKMIIFTSPGERIMDSNFGVGIRRYLFEPISELTNIEITDRIREQLSRYLPFIVIEELVVTSPEQSENAIYLRLQYSFDSQETQLLEFIVT